MRENENRIKLDSAKWTTVQENFHAKFEAPLDLAWQCLTEAEKIQCDSLLAFKNAKQEESIQKVLSIFNGKIVSAKAITEEVPCK